MLLPHSRPARRRAGLVALSVVLVASAGCVSDSSEEKPETEQSLSAEPLPSPSAKGERDPELERYYSQDVEWSDCRKKFECATVQVPLDYAKPGGETIELSLTRLPASGKGRSVGSLLVNPGGPGSSGVDFALRAESYFGDDVRRAFDIVGFDPRGVGRSTPVDCVTDERLDAFVATDPDPDTPAEVRRGDALLRELGEGCLEKSGDLAGHISTAEAARDIDIIREVLGDRRLSWFGASYGTLLGATYAELFPDRVGRMVLDGAIDPTLSERDKSLVQAEAFEVALRSYVKACVDGGDCFLGETVDEGTKRIRDLLDRIDRRPIRGDGDRKLTVGTAVLGIWTPLYQQQIWPLLDGALQAAFAGDGQQLLRLADFYVSRGPSGYLDNSLEALYAINCLDQQESVSSEEAEKLVPEFEEVSPTFGAVFAYGLTSCSEWPVEGEGAVDEIDAEGSEPILVVGTTRDPATPLSWAEALADQLVSGVLLVRDGDGHTGYNAGNECIDRTVESYLVSGEVPESGTRC